MRLLAEKWAGLIGVRDGVGGSRSPRDGSEREEGTQRREPNAVPMGILVAVGADAERLLRPYPPADSHSEPRRLGLVVSPHSSAGGWSSRIPHCRPLVVSSRGPPARCS